MGVIWGMAHWGITSGVPDFGIWTRSIYDGAAVPGPVVFLAYPIRISMSSIELYVVFRIGDGLIGTYQRR